MGLTSWHGHKMLCVNHSINIYCGLASVDKVEFAKINGPVG